MSLFDVLSSPDVYKITIERTYIFAIGGIVTFLLNKLLRFIGTSWNKKLLSKLEGYWLETIPQLENEGRQYSIGHFYFHRSSNSFRYDGKNYLLEGNSCSPYYNWICKTLDQEIGNKQILYVYKVVKYDSGASIKFGFGVAYIDSPPEGYIFKSGFFVDADKNNLNIRNYKTLDINELAKKLRISQNNFNNIDEFHEKIIIQYHKSRDELKM